MSLFLGIDTSNYTTSTALYDSKTGEMVQQKKLLPVKEGQLGLRQSDAVFHHTAQLHTLIEELLKDVDTSKIAAIAAILLVSTSFKSSSISVCSCAVW